MSGIKVHYPIRRKAGTSIPDFSHSWITTHAELAKTFPLIRGMRSASACPAFALGPAILLCPLLAARRSCYR